VAVRSPAKAVIVATGIAWRRLGVPRLEALVGSGVFYGAAAAEARAMAGRDVFVAGAGNSGGQAALHLARYARRVTMLVRGDSLARSMSEYLIREIEPPAISWCACTPRSATAMGPITWKLSRCATGAAAGQNGSRRPRCLC
jgi:thioredoxin reductase (NADPH)